MTKKSRPALPSGGGSYTRDKKGELKLVETPTKERLRSGAETPVEEAVEAPSEETPK